MADDDMNLSHAAGQVVAEALQHTRTLFCPFCAVSFMFEFTLKDHLKAEHRKEIAQQLQHQQHQQAGDGIEDSDDEEVCDGDAAADSDDVLSRSIQQCQHKCPFCNAAFNHLGLIPKHIGNHHGSELLLLWQQQSGNAERLAAVRQLEPSILYAGCSPGLSGWFQQMMSTDDAGSARNTTGEQSACEPTATTSTTSSSSSSCMAGQPRKIKSILKKTPVKQRASSQSLAPFVTIRRSKSDVVKRSLSARRELRFDPSTKHGSTVSPMSGAMAALSPRLGGGGGGGIIKKSSSLRLLRNPFGFVRRVTGGGRDATAATGSGANTLITSTPIGLLDDHGAMELPMAAGRTQMDNWKATVRQVTTTSAAASPLRLRSADNGTAGTAGAALAGRISVSEQPFQCALCKQTYAQNAELVSHLRAQHRGLKDWLRPQFSCTGCQTTFYSNRHLVRHCHGGQCTVMGRLARCK